MTTENLDAQATTCSTKYPLAQLKNTNYFNNMSP